MKVYGGTVQGGGLRMTAMVLAHHGLQWAAVLMLACLN
jgi:hypothetical protein